MSPLPLDRSALIAALKAVVGASFVHTSDRATRRFRKGFRFGEGRVLAAVQPGSLLEQWKVLQAVVESGCVVIFQAANTGLTGGSTPFGDDYDRDIVVISTLRLKGVQLINEGRQVICLPGATLDRLEQTLKPLGREPHSVIGSSCIGASVLGGICNNSGGALVRRGPAYTEMALFAQLGADGRLELVNHLGVHLGNSPEEILSRLEGRVYTEQDIDNSGERRASDSSYARTVREIDAATPARFNADSSRHYEASGCAGKLAVFAVRLDTFASEASQVFYIGSNDPGDLSGVRRHMLTAFETLPIAGEYIHRDAFDIGERYGKDSFYLIDKLGTERVPAAFAMKARFDAFFEGLGLHGVTDRVAQWISALLPAHLPERIKGFRQRFDHHLLLRVAAHQADATRQFLSGYFGPRAGDWFECTPEEGRKAFLHRFAVAGAAVRYRAIHRQQVEDIVALDIALRRNDEDWMETLPPAIESQLIHKLYYGHFFCHVFHQDYIVRKGSDPMAIEHAMWGLLDRRGAEYPAEHNVGHLYHAKPALQSFYRQLDPSNSFNPGIGLTSKRAHWGSADTPAPGACCEGH